MRNIFIAPSLLAADHDNLAKEIHLVEELGCQYLHFDVMDNKFVPNLSFGVAPLREIAHIHHMVNDVHLMIEEPLKFASDFLSAGADYLTFHLEACKDNKEALDIISLVHKNNKKVGISIKPKTDVKELLPYLDKVDLILIMSVEPGFGGQKFIPSALEKISYLRKEIDEHKYPVLIEVDGGINEETAKLVKEAGVDIIVAGSYLFGHEDIKERINKIK